MSAVTPAKKRILLVGGHWKNVPAWVRASFDLEHVAQDRDTGSLETAKAAQADVVVILTSWCSYHTSLQAHELARQWGVPALHSRQGWSAVLQEAGRRGLTWLMDAVKAHGDSPEPSESAQEARGEVEGAWKAVAEDSQARERALEKRLAKVERAMAEQGAHLTRLRSGAEARVLAEIRRRANEVRQSERARLIPLQEAVTKLLAALEPVGQVQAQLKSLLQDPAHPPG